MADGIIRRSEANTKALEREKYWERTMSDPSNPANRYRNYLVDVREKERLDAENQRAMALENRKQLGQFDIAKLQDAGQTARSKMAETGLNRRSDVEQANMAKYRGDTIALDRDKLDFGKTQAERSFALDRDKALFEQFATIKGLDNGGLGVDNPGTQGDIMGQWNMFRNNAGGLTNETMDLAIAKKINAAKAKGLSFDKINFTDAERSLLVGGINSSGANTNQNSINRLDWIEGKDGQRRYFDQSGDEVAFNAPSSRSDFSGVPDQLMASHRSGAGAPQAATTQLTASTPSSGLNENAMWPAPVKNRTEHFKQTLENAQDDAAFKRWINSGPNYSRKNMTEQMKRSKYPDYRRY
ncbi:hypothetical protein [Desulfobacter postgatei]|uniref:hypothetical protein n=1 Tax=Desulfobacter postgatei TaxID=2293 RepID=UPI00259B2983|nr:hypothetical protein [uncultured Desulfobacter sp.]